MNIEPPKDVKGREIPLDTKVLYDMYGGKNNVRLFAYFANTDTWRVMFTDSTSYFAASDMCLDEPDTWEKLEEDLGRAAKRDAVTSQCRYFNTTNRCVNCPIHNGDGGCTHKDERAFWDILGRIRKLRDEGE